VRAGDKSARQPGRCQLLQLVAFSSSPTECLHGRVRVGGYGFWRRCETNVYILNPLELRPNEASRPSKQV
jgi:hypothetical protein